MTSLFLLLLQRVSAQQTLNAWKCHVSVLTLGELGQGMNRTMTAALEAILLTKENKEREIERERTAEYIRLKQRTTC